MSVTLPQFCRGEIKVYRGAYTPFGSNSAVNNVIIINYKKKNFCIYPNKGWEDRARSVIDYVERRYVNKIKDGTKAPKHKVACCPICLCNVVKLKGTTSISGGKGRMHLYQCVQSECLQEFMVVETNENS